MKADGTPDKIYVDANEGWFRTFIAFTDKAKGNDIEYTRTDDFIEKACDMYCKVCGHYAHKTPTYICRQTCDYYKDFRKHIEEE